MASESSLDVATDKQTETEVSTAGSDVTPENKEREKKEEKVDLSYLSVNQKAKIEREEEAHNKIEPSTSKVVVVIKWAVTVIFGGLLLGSVALSKLTVLGLSSLLTPEEGPMNDRVFVMLLIIIEIPYILGFIRAIWTVIGRSDMSWPKKTTVFWCVVFSVLESFGVCLLVFKSCTLVPSSVSILFMSAVFIIPTFNLVLKSFRTKTMIRQARLIFIIALVLAIAAVILTIVCAFNTIFKSKSDVWHIIVGIVCISVAWSPFSNGLMLQSKKKIEKEIVFLDSWKDDDNLENSINMNMMSQNTDGTNSRSSSYPQSTSAWGSETQSLQNFSARNNRSEIEREVPDRKCVHRSLAITSGLKIPLALLFSFVLFYFDRDKSLSLSTAWSNFSDGWNMDTNREFYLFIANISSSILAYIIGVFACRTCMDRGAFIMPLLLVTPVLAALLLIKDTCQPVMIWNTTMANRPFKFCQTSSSDIPLVIGAVVLFMIVQTCTVGWLIFKSSSVVLQKERKLFWQLSYSSVILDQWFLLNRKTPEMTKANDDDPKERGKRSNVYICTTMYRENRTEMKQLLESINLINKAQGSGCRHFEAHVFLDGAVKGEELTEYALQLVSLLRSTLEIEKVEVGTKTLTPYGMKLTWELPGQFGQKKMTFNIHMKDNKKVKSKKRWSQIMYMSYVLDFLNKQNVDQDGSPQDNEEEAFILTTDADVKFTPQSVEALLDLMTRDTRVGAVCARTHPLGDGPLVWYQKFEYAIGHWFQKVAEHVLGSVLCAPGCFSVYRCSAIRDLLPTYASTVMKAFDFLIKDMGEDRWLCTLMVQSGWRIEYCAASENETFCPEEFEEFYKQRRRWIASTLANIMSLIQDWRLIRMLNHRVSILFCLYQIFLLCSTFVGPSTVILVVSGGLTYAWDIDLITTAVIQAVVCVGYTMICLYGNQKLQMQASKLLTFIYALVMTAVAVGIAEQVADDLTPNRPVINQVNGTDVIVSSTTSNPNAISVDIPVSVTSIYLGGLIGIFLATGLLHPQEIFCLLNGLTYLLCLPSGYLILNIYSICNITDRTWGTREKKTDTGESKTSRDFTDVYQSLIRKIFFCCFQKKDEETSVTEQEVPDRQTGSKTVPATFMRSGSSPVVQDDTAGRSETGMQDRTKIQGEDEIDGMSGFPVSVDIWMPEDFKKDYVQLFKANGYENTIFISSMTEKTLKEIGVKNSLHRNYLQALISDLPEFKIEAALPNDVMSWLDDIGLPEYKENFKRNKTTTVKELAHLKTFTDSEIEKELGINKKGHVERLKKAITMLRVPTREDIQRGKIRKLVENAFMHDMKSVNAEEYKFWSDLIRSCVKPSPDAFTSGEELKEKLVELRNNWLMVYGVVNCLWLVVILTLSGSVQLRVIGTNPLSVVFLGVFGFIFVLQFLCMLVHRFTTFSHYVARAPYKFGQAYRTAWAFSDKNVDTEPDNTDDNMISEVQQAQRNALKKMVNKHRKNKTLANDKQPLMRNGGHASYSSTTSDVNLV